jgi:hypothetical protein
MIQPSYVALSESVPLLLVHLQWVKSFCCLNLYDSVYLSWLTNTKLCSDTCYLYRSGGAQRQDPFLGLAQFGM